MVTIEIRACEQTDKGHTMFRIGSSVSWEWTSIVGFCTSCLDKKFRDRDCYKRNKELSWSPTFNLYALGTKREGYLMK